MPVKIQVLNATVWQLAIACGKARKSRDLAAIKKAVKEQEDYLQLVRECDYDFADTDFYSSAIRSIK
jgi:hypothetical protein